MSNKKCNKCLEDKDISEFWNKQTQCKSCKMAGSREYYNKNKHTHPKYKSRKYDIKSLIEGKITYRNLYHGNMNNIIKKYLISNKIIEYKCNKCGINKWNQQPITLDLDHIDGNRENNVLDNLRFLCPNCHSQTDTWKGKNK